MLKLFVTVVCLSLTAALPILDPERVETEDLTEVAAMDFLKAYGYVHEDAELDHLDSEPLKAGLLAYQQRRGMEETGELDEPTKEMMRAPRCGVPDVGNYDTYGPKWPETSLSFRVKNDNNDELSESTINSVMMGALLKWGTVTPLTFTKATSGEDISIGFYKGSHLGHPSFDGSRGVLAHAMSPTSGVVCFDDDEAFDLNSDINIHMVALHEFGHTLGLKHTDVAGSVMLPEYNIDHVDLADDDVKGIQYLYGART